MKDNQTILIPKLSSYHQQPDVLLELNKNEDPQEVFKFKQKLNIQWTKEQYEKMGIQILCAVDDLLWKAVLPEGWVSINELNKEWTTILDNKNRKRARFYYKVTSETRNVFIYFFTRYRKEITRAADISVDWITWSKSPYVGYVYDCDCVIFQTQSVLPTQDYNSNQILINNLKEEIEMYLRCNMPEYEDIHAYWN